MTIARRRQLRRRPYAMLIAFVAAAFVTLVVNPRGATAACVVTTAGTVNCATDTVTTYTTNLDGARSISHDRQQLFDNDVAISGTIQSGVTVGGIGLQLTEAAGAGAQSVTLDNQGEVTSGLAINALRLDGNGGGVRYFGDGSVTNTGASGAALLVDGPDGASIVTGSGAISGPTAIQAHTSGGALTIDTGSGLVSSTLGPAISASALDAPISITIGSGGVTTTSEFHAISATSTNGDISIKAKGAVSGGFPCFAPPFPPGCFAGGALAISNGVGNIRVGGSGTYSASGGRGIQATQSVTGLGGIVVTGSGNTFAGTSAYGNASAIRAEIFNPADSSNILIDRSGDVIGVDTFPPDNVQSISSDMHALTLGTGNITVVSGAGATLSNAGIFGIETAEFGKASSGSIAVSTGAQGAITVGGAGILAINAAFAIPTLARSSISVTNNGTISSGAKLIPVGHYFGDGGGAGDAPAGILAGYNGGPRFGKTSGPYTSCAYFGCTTLKPNPNVNGVVSVVNNGAINAAGGNGIFAFNFGNGDVSVASFAPITVTGAGSRNGIEAFSAEVGAISVATSADVTALHGNGVYTNNVGKGTTTIDVSAGVVEGGGSGVTANAVDGAISIVNSGAIQNISGQPGDVAIRTSGSAATLTNSPDGVVTGIVSMTGAGAHVFANAGVWNTLGASTFAGSGGLDNSGVLNALGATTLLGPTTLTNSGVVNLAGAAGSTGDFPTLTTRNYVGAGGVLAINAALGPDDSPSGKLVIDGGSATGRTVVIVNNAGGPGGPTLANGIEVVEAINGATTAPGAFTLGARVAAGAYEYQLYDGGNPATGGDPNDQDWYLRSSGYRPEVPLDMAIPALASRFGLEMIGTYHDRVGEEGVLDATAGPNAADGTAPSQLSRLAGWGRLLGEIGSGSLSGGGPGYDFGLSGFQTGVDLYRRANADRSQDSAGLYVGAGAATGSVNQATGGAAGDLSMNGYTLGGYWTHRGASGWYVDALAQTTFYDNVSADSAAGQAFATDGWGLAASLEGGYPIALGHGLTIEPQAQAIFQRISLGGGQDAYGLIDFGDADPLYGRIGARLSRLWTLDNGSAIETWGRANLWRAFGGDASTTFATLSGADPVTFGTSLGGTWAQFGLGASSRIVRNVAVFASADCDLAVDGARGHGYDARIGVKIAW